MIDDIPKLCKNNLELSPKSIQYRKRPQVLEHVSPRRGRTDSTTYNVRTPGHSMSMKHRTSEIDIPLSWEKRSPLKPLKASNSGTHLFDIQAFTRQNSVYTYENVDNRDASPERQITLNLSSIILKEYNEEISPTNSIVMPVFKVLEMKSEITNEIHSSKDDCFNKFRRILICRDAARKDGNMSASKHYNQKLINLDIYNSDYHKGIDLQGNNDLVDEDSVGLLPSDLKRYMLYCRLQGVCIILRDVSLAAAREYAGTYHLHPQYLDPITKEPIYELVASLQTEQIQNITQRKIRSFPKLLQVGLKSSNYAPIDGLIPRDPRLSKLEGQFTQSLKELEQKLRRSSVDASDFAMKMSIAMAIITAEKDHSLLLQRYMRKQEKEMEMDSARYKEMYRAYSEEMMYCLDKLEVSKRWLVRFNDAKFLGFSLFQNPQGHIINYFVRGPEVARNVDELPIFAISCENTWFIYQSGSGSYIYDEEQKLSKLIEDGYIALPVEVMVYQAFVVHPITGRITECPEKNQTITPDYDGLSYAYNQVYPLNIVSSNYSDLENINLLVDFYEKSFENIYQLTFKEGMGYVSNQDIEFITEMRDLTEWKQNHGLESNNLYKSENIDTGNYLAFDSNGDVKLLRNLPEIIQYYRAKWLEGVPLPINPKWQVEIDENGLPYHSPELDVYDNSLDWAILLARCQHSGGRVTMESLENRWVTFLDYENHVPPQGLEFIEYCKLKDEEKAMEIWIKIRQLQLRPLMVLHNRTRSYIPDQQADIIDRLFPDVISKIKISLQKDISNYVRELHHSRCAFFQKYHQECRVTIPPNTPMPF